jgi:hypothetical protein
MLCWVPKNDFGLHSCSERDSEAERLIMPTSQSTDSFDVAPGRMSDLKSVEVKIDSGNAWIL